MREQCYWSKILLIQSQKLCPLARSIRFHHLLNINRAKCFADGIGQKSETLFVTLTTQKPVPVCKSHTSRELHLEISILYNISTENLQPSEILFHWGYGIIDNNSYKSNSMMFDLLIGKSFSLLLILRPVITTREPTILHRSLSYFHIDFALLGM